MKQYTIGALFTPDFSKVLLILKTKPEWQRGKFNLPGGSFENGESAEDCVNREFAEECGIDKGASCWQHIGKIVNPGNYSVDFLTTIYYQQQDGDIQCLTEEKVEWHEVDSLPVNVISNLHWLIPFAKNIWLQGNAGGLKFGQFEYAY